MLTRRVTLVLAALALAVPAAAHARDGDGHDVRVSGSCPGRATATLRLRVHDGDIRAEFEVRRRRGGERWRVVLVHERRVAWRANVRTGGSGSFRVRRTVADFDGADQVTVRATGPRGTICEASATLRD